MSQITLRRIANGAGLAVLGVAIVLAVILVAPGLLGAESSLVVKSDSMSPAIGAGDIVVISATDAKALSAGTVVTYRATGGDRSVVTHRIVEVVDSEYGVRYRTKGDANEGPDTELVAPRQVIGTVWFKIPALGHLVTFANTRLGLASLVIAPAMLLLLTEVYTFYKDAKAENTSEG